MLQKNPNKAYKKKRKISLSSSAVQTSILMLLVLAASFPFLKDKLPNGHDALEYLPRLAEFDVSLRAGELKPSWAPDLSFGYGQPFFLYNPPLFYYVSALIHHLGGFSYTLSLNLAVVFLLFIGAEGIRRTAREWFGPHAALVSAAAFLFMPYLQVELYVRRALAEFTAITLMPWTIFFFYKWIFSNRSRYLTGSVISLSLFFLCHNALSFVFTPVLALTIIIFCLSARSWGSLFRAGGAFVLAFGAAGWFLFPAYFEKHWIKTHKLIDEDYANLFLNHFVYPRQLWFSKWGYGVSVKGTGDGMSFNLGRIQSIFTLLGLAALPFKSFRQSINIHGFIAALLIATIGTVMSITSAEPLYRLVIPLQYLQFPWRTLALPVVGLALCAGAFWALFRRLNRVLNIPIVSLAVLVILFHGLPYVKFKNYKEIDERKYYPKMIAARNLAVTTRREYEPVWVKKTPPFPPAEKLKIFRGKGKLKIEYESVTEYIARLQSKEPVKLDFYVNYFPGWILKTNGRLLKPAIVSPYGYMRFNIPPGESALNIRFAGTPARRTGDLVSLFSVILLLYWTFIIVYRNKIIKKAGLTRPTRDDELNIPDFEEY